MLTGNPGAAAAARARAQASRRWAELRDRLLTVSPQGVGRAALAITVSAVLAWFAVASWPALAPFAVGAVLAYAVLPIANRLDAFMPRMLAALIAELVAIGVLLGAIVLVVPPLLRGLVQVALRLPTPAEIQTALADFQAQLGDLPEPIRGIVLAVATETVARLRDVLDGIVSGAAGFITDQILGIFGTVSFVLGLLVIPVWVLTLVADEGNIKRRAARLVSPGFRQDALALIRIVDRAFSAFLRGRVLLAITTAALAWVGLEIAQAAGIDQFPFAVTAATLFGILQLIPELGFFLGFFPILLVLALGGPAPALAVTVVYVLAVKGAEAIVGTRVGRGVLDVHPGLLIPGIVVLSQFGVGWLLIAGPMIAITRDIVRYLGGRLAEPPAPAGLLPGDRPRTRPAVAAPVPSVYRTAVTRERSTVP